MSDDKTDIFGAVKTGDLARVIYLVEVQLAAVNQHDQWDATPLYYASFTGNEEIVKYLLNKGAHCEEKTFDGERCLYAALNSKVRSLLLDKGFKRQGARGHDPYLEFVESLLEAPAFHDILLPSCPPCHSLKAHRFLLAARCPALGRLMTERLQGGKLVADLAGLPLQPLHAIFRWCYTCRLEVPVADSEATQQLLQRLDMPDLADSLAARCSDQPGGQSSGAVVVEPGREEAKAQLQEAMDRVADACTLATPSEQPPYHSDIKLSIAGRDFWSHKEVLCARSEFFHTLLTSPNFREGRRNARLADSESPAPFQCVPLEFGDPDVLGIALRWMYAECMDGSLNADILLEVMRYAEAIICDPLKHKCALMLVPHVTPESTIPLLDEGMRVAADRLERACLRMLALHLHQLISDGESKTKLAELVRESACSVEQRQEFDSIPLVDEVRYYIAQLHGGGEQSDDDSDWDEEGNVICSGLEEDFQALSLRKQKLYLLQELMADVGYEA